MHIAFLNPQGNFDPEDSYWAEHQDFGGQLVYVKEVAGALSAMGHRVDILTRRIIDPDWPEFSAPVDGYPNFPNLRIVRIPCGPDAFLEKEMLWLFLATEWVPNILAFYHQDGQLPDVFTAHYGDGGLAAAVIEEQTGIPYSFTGHSLGAQKLEKMVAAGSQIEALETRYHFSTRIAAERACMNRAAAIITSTGQERDTQYRHPAYRDAVEVGGGDKFSVIPPGVNLQVFSQKAGGLDSLISEQIDAVLAQALPEERRDLPVVISASRLEAKKNIAGVVRAFIVNKELQDRANLLIAMRASTDGFQQTAFFQNQNNPALQEIAELIAEEGLTEKVAAVPINGQDELAATYRILAQRGSVFVLAALHEPFGLAPLEAMACGLPSVVTKNGGPTESMVEGGEEYGILVDPLRPEEIAAGLLRLLESPAVWEKFRDAGVRRVLDKYTWQQTAQGYDRVLSGLAQQAAKGKRGKRIAIPEYFFSPDESHRIPTSILGWLVK